MFIKLNKIVTIFFALLLQAGSVSFTMQENKENNENLVKGPSLLKPRPRPQQSQQGFFENFQELERDEKKAAEEFRISLNKTIIAILDDNTPVVIAKLRAITADPEIRENIKTIIKDSLRDPEVASAARNFIENANKSILSTKNFVMLMWLIPGITASRNLAPIIVKYLSKQNSDRIQWQKIINNKHAKLLALVTAGIASSGVQAFAIEKLIQGTKLTILAMIWLTKSLFRSIS